MMLMHCAAADRYITFSGLVNLDFATANKLKYNITAHATGVYNVSMFDLTGAMRCHLWRTQLV